MLDYWLALCPHSKKVFSMFSLNTVRSHPLCRDSQSFSCLIYLTWETELRSSYKVTHFKVCSSSELNFLFKHFYFLEPTFFGKKWSVTLVLSKLMRLDKHKVMDESQSLDSTFLSSAESFTSLTISFSSALCTAGSISCLSPSGSVSFRIARTQNKNADANSQTQTATNQQAL